ncbi:gliding motility lipoprotein GldH [Thermophagus xiamenensis]|uniref:gliding motility lipoprotein GldH n=1 Tax=Thermophagus xiamenensis TaxID=385682 RepID=UPI000255CA6E|nr:gliding motility lipoprotein GldH [Thermophagus xiamenensis]
MEETRTEDLEINPQSHRETVKAKWLFALLVFVFGTFACEEITIYEKGQELAGQVWDKDSTLFFYPEIRDTSQVVNIGFSFVHNNDYPYSNLWLFINVLSPDGHMQTDTMEFFVAEPTGEWIGKGSDNKKTVYWLYKNDVKLNAPGKFTFSVTQGMRRDALPGVRSFYLWIEKALTRETNSD